MLNCNTYTTNAPIICNAPREAEDYARRVGVPLKHVDPLELIVTLKAASQMGDWCIVDCAEVETDALRNAVTVVWLQGSWDHHPKFRAWFAHEPFMTPLTSQFTLDNTSNGFTLSPARGSTVAARLRIEAANAHLPLSLITGAVYLKYSDSFEDEFNIRSLVNAVGNSQLFYTKEYRTHMTVLSSRHLLGLFRLATREDIFIALAEQGMVDNAAKQLIISARGDANDSAMDIALKKEFIQGATVLRDLGCASDSFDFNDLLKPSFATALRVLLQPDKPFPFDPIATVAHVAREGHARILNRLFCCRIDSHFEYNDYPLADACLSDSEEIVWIVLDRMGSTGVSPLTEPRWALYHLLSILRSTSVVSSPNNGQSRLHTSRESYTLNPTSLMLVRKFLGIVEGEGGTYHIPVDVLTRSMGYPDIMQSLMRLLNPHEESNAPALLEFFAEFDPNNVHMEEMVRRSYREMPRRLSGRPLEVEVYHLLWHLLKQGATAGRMYRIAVDCSVHYGYLDFTYRGDAGDTLLHKAIQCGRFDVESIGFTFYRMSGRDRMNLINAEDAEGRGGIDALVHRAFSTPMTPQEELSVADGLRLMLFAGGQILPERASVIYNRAVAIGYPLIAYEVLKGSGCSFNMAVLSREISEAMVIRSRTAPTLDSNRFRETIEMASDVLSAVEVQQILDEAGATPEIPLLVTCLVDERLSSNTLPFKSTAGQQQLILSTIVDYLDRPSFNGFHDLCFATYFACMGRQLPPIVPFEEIFANVSPADGPKLAEFTDSPEAIPPVESTPTSV